MEREPFVLAELEDLSPVFAPLKSATRVKYTCFNVSTNLLVIGASSGGLYVFRREPCVFLQLLPSKEGPVAQVAISPDERLLGVATARGTVSLVERNQRGARVVASSFEHAGAAVTALCWGNGELFAGDTLGRISVLARTVFQPPAALLMQLDSRIVQLDASAGLLLVSTLTRSYVCDTERELYRQVGHKLRDGPFGGCFLSSDQADDASDSRPTERARRAFSDSEKTNLDYSHLRHLRAFCSRPGARVWEVDAEGTVLRTHHFKEALASSPVNITTDHTLDNNNRLISKHSEQPVNFGRLFVILTRYLLTYTGDAVFVLDPERSDMVLWCNQLRDIVDIRVTNNVLYVWCASGKMHALNLVPLEKFLIRMYFWKKYLMVAELCLEFSDYLQRHAPNSSKLHLLKDLDEKLKDQEDASPSLVTNLTPLLEILRTHAQNTQVQNAQKLKSGIYQITRPSYLNLKNRSHSVSPDRLEKPSHGSTSSLPGLVMEEEEVASDYPAVEADSKEVVAVTELCPRMTPAPTPEEVRELLTRVLRLCDGEGGEDPLTAARPLPFRAIFGPEHVAAIARAFRLALTSKLLTDFLKDMPSPDVDITHPEYLRKTLESNVLDLDLKLSRMLRIFVNVVDEAHIVEDIKAALPQCHYLCLLEVVSRFEASTMNLSDSLSPPRMLSVVAFLLKVGQVDQISRWAHRLDLWDLMYLALHREADDGRAARIAFLSILDSWKAGAAAWLPLEQFVIHCLEAVEEGGACECGFPIPAGKRQGSPRFLGLGTALLEAKSADAAAMVRVCGAVPWLWPTLLRMRTADDLLTLLPLILHLGDLDELERRLPEMDYLVCEVLVRHLAGLHRGDCLNCGRKLSSPPAPGVSWTQAGLLLLKAVGHTQTLTLLTQYQGDVSGLDPVFHRAVVLSAIMEKHSPGLRHGVVDVLAGRSRQASLLSPSLQAEIFPDSPALSPSTPPHWGMRLDLSRSTCPVCSLPLTARVLTDAGVVAFRCRHAFHAVCLRNKDVCPSCAHAQSDE